MARLRLVPFLGDAKRVENKTGKAILVVVLLPVAIVAALVIAGLLIRLLTPN